MKQKIRIPDDNPKKVRMYLEFYRPFFDRFGDCDPRQVDRAFWSFGRFLSLEYSGIVTSPSDVIDRAES